MKIIMELVDVALIAFSIYLLSRGILLAGRLRRRELPHDAARLLWFLATVIIAMAIIALFCGCMSLFTEPRDLSIG